MALELKQQVRLSQQLVMTPQLQQAIKLLQLSRMELVGLVQHELEENPVLEEVLEGEEERESAEAAGQEGADAGDDAGGISADADGSADLEVLPAEPAEAGADEVSDAPEPGEVVEAGAEPEPTDAEKIADVDWQSYAESQPQTGMREAVDDDDRPSLDATLTRRENLSDHLLWQLQLASFPVEEEVAARFIIGNLDERGYLQSSLEELARQSGVKIEIVEAALRRVQDFDPPGVAA